MKMKLLPFAAVVCGLLAVANCATVVVTGGLGFIGSHVTEELLKDGHKVTDHPCLTAYQCSCPVEMERAKCIMNATAADMKITMSESCDGLQVIIFDDKSNGNNMNKDAHWIFNDISTTDDFEKITEPVDYVIHLAAASE